MPPGPRTIRLPEPLIAASDIVERAGGVEDEHAIVRDGSLLFNEPVAPPLPTCSVPLLMVVPPE